MSDTSPAIKSYCFGKAYSDLVRTIAEAWQANWQVSGYFFGRIARAWEHGLLSGVFFSLLWGSAALAVFVFGNIFTALFSILHVFIVMMWMVLILTLFISVAVLERIIIHIRHYTSHCPVCYEKFGLPVYLCDNPDCGRAHPRLIPSAFGILKHTCRCGRKLPCTWFTNRGRLQSKCPACDALLSRENVETPKQFIAVVGAPSVGKSAYLFSLCRQFREYALPAVRLSARFVDQGQETLYGQVIAEMDQGKPPDKTAEVLPKAFDLLVQGKHMAKRMVYFHDPAGEAYLDSANLVPFKFLDYLSGILFLVDPFAIHTVQKRYARELRTTPGIRPSQSLLEDTLSRLINVMEAEFNLSPMQKITVPLAVVVNKVDAFDLETVIGATALQNTPYLNDTETAAQRQNRVIYRALQQWQEAAFLHMLDTRFSHVRYFTVSALGRSPDNTTAPFTPRRVLAPVQWLLEQGNPVWKALEPGRET